MALEREQVLAALQTVKDPELFKDIVTLGMLKDLLVKAYDVSLTVELTNPTGPLRELVERDITVALRRIGAERVVVNVTAPPGGPKGVSERGGALPQVRHVIAVGAGKGGVGKSTIAANVAVGLSRTGAKVGLMDGDIYGPSMPTLLGIKGAMVKSTKVNDVMKIVPFNVHGIHTITIGNLVEQDKPLIWRGPMAHGAFKQLLVDNTHWPELDYLIVDLPPGTGDVPLTLCQLLPLSGAVIVATPQQVALDDAIRAVRMFQQLAAPILGIVENMSYFPLPDGTSHDLFGRGGARKAADALGVPFLGERPMVQQLRLNSDAGAPLDNFSGAQDLRIALENLVNNLIREVDRNSASAAAPKLTIS